MAAPPESAGPRIAVALDTPDPAAAVALADRLEPRQCRLKVGKELFTAGGPRVVEMLMTRGFDVFLDLKYHDIPNTVRAACRVAAGLGVWMVNVHASGGAAMLEAAREGVNGVSRPPVLVAVTVLTSLDRSDLEQIGFGIDPAALGLRLTHLALDHGCDGVVCSAREVAAYRAELGAAPVLVTPGIRPASAPADDQKRGATPGEAIAAGADILVVGRPITAAADPVAALHGIGEEVAQAGAAR